MATKPTGGDEGPKAPPVPQQDARPKAALPVVPADLPPGGPGAGEMPRADDDAAMGELFGGGARGAGAPIDDFVDPVPPTPEELGATRGGRRPNTSAPGRPGPRGDAKPPEQTDFQMSADDRTRLAKSIESGLEVNPDWPRVVCMKLGPPGETCASLMYWGGAGALKIDFEPFQRSAPIHPAIVADVVKDVPNKPYGFYWKTFWLTPPVLEVDANGAPTGSGKRGDCKGTMGWTDKASGRWVETCIYGNCPRHPMSGLHHSIWQAQRYLANMKTDSAIRAYVRNYDARAEVGSFATLVIDARQSAMMRAVLGTNEGNANRDDIIF